MHPTERLHSARTFESVNLSQWSMMTTILCNRSSGFSGKMAFVSVEWGESIHDAGKMKRMKPEEARSQACVRRAALGSPRYRGSASSAQHSGPGVSTVFMIPGASEMWTLLTENASVHIRDEGGEGI